MRARHVFWSFDEALEDRRVGSVPNERVESEQHDILQSWLITLPILFLFRFSQEGKFSIHILPFIMSSVLVFMDYAGFFDRERGLLILINRKYI